VNCLSFFDLLESTVMLAVVVLLRDIIIASSCDLCINIFLYCHIGPRINGINLQLILLHNLLPIREHDYMYLHINKCLYS